MERSVVALQLRRLAVLSLALLAAGCTGQGGDRPLTVHQSLSNCGSGYLISWPGHPSTPLATCAGIAGWANARSAPTVHIRVGQQLEITRALGPIAVTNSRALVDWHIEGGSAVRALAPGSARIIIAAASCLDRNPSETPCTLVNVLVTP